MNLGALVILGTVRRAKGGALQSRKLSFSIWTPTLSETEEGQEDREEDEEGPFLCTRRNQHFFFLVLFVPPSLSGGFLTLRESRHAALSPQRASVWK